MAEDEKLLKCVFNGTLSICTADKKDELIKLSNTRIEKIETSSIKRSDEFSGSLNVEYAYAHNGCYLNYTSSDHIKHYSKRTGITVGQTTSTADVKRRRRSELSSFSFKRDCLFCGEVCSVVIDPKHPERWKNNKGVLCRTADRGGGKKTFKEVILEVMFSLVFTST